MATLGLDEEETLGKLTLVSVENESFSIPVSEAKKYPYLAALAEKGKTTIHIPKASTVALQAVTAFVRGEDAGLKNKSTYELKLIAELAFYMVITPLVHKALEEHRRKIAGL